MACTPPARGPHSLAVGSAGRGRRDQNQTWRGRGPRRLGPGRGGLRGRGVAWMEPRARGRGRGGRGWEKRGRGRGRLEMAEICLGRQETRCSWRPHRREAGAGRKAPQGVGSAQVETLPPPAEEAGGPAPGGECRGVGGGLGDAGSPRSSAEGRRAQCGAPEPSSSRTWLRGALAGPHLGTQPPRRRFPARPAQLWCGRVACGLWTCLSFPSHAEVLGAGRASARGGAAQVSACQPPSLSFPLRAGGTGGGGGALSRKRGEHAGPPAVTIVTAVIVTSAAAPATFTLGQILCVQGHLFRCGN